METVPVTPNITCVYVTHTVHDPVQWESVDEINPLERIWLRPVLNEVFDMQWSPDSTHLLVGAIDCKVTFVACLVPCIW
jgi:hypothetical protein